MPGSQLHLQPARRPSGGAAARTRAGLARLSASPDARALAAVLAVLALFFAPALGGGQFLGLDTGAMHHPVKAWIAEELRAGHVPQWNPYLGLGVPILAGAVDGVLHPFTLLLVALPFETAFRLWVLLSYPLAAAGAFLWARRLGASPPAAAVAAIAYPLSGYLVSSAANLTFLTGLAALPLVLATAHGFVERPGPARLALVALAGYLAGSAGDPQSFVLVALALPAAAAATVAEPTSPVRRALRGGVAAAVALAAAAPVLLPVAVWIPHSSRGDPLDAVDVARFNLHPLRIVELAVPHLVRGEPGAAASLPYRAFVGDPNTVRPWIESVHVGAAALALAALAAARGRRGARVLLAAAALALWMALGPHAGFTEVARWLPVLSRFRFWEKLAALVALAVAAAAALGAEVVVRERPRRFAPAVAAVGAALLLAALALLVWGEDAAAAAGGDRLAAARRLVGNTREGLLSAGGVLLALAAAAHALAGGRLAARGAALLPIVVAGELVGSSSRAWSLSPLDASSPRAPLAERLRMAPGLQRVVAGGRDPEPAEVDHPGLTEYEDYARFYARGLYPAFNVQWRIGNFQNYVGLPPARAMRYERRSQGGLRSAAVGLFGVGHLVVPFTPERAAELGYRPPYAVVASDPDLPASLVALPHRPRAYLAETLRSVDRRVAMEFALAADPRSDVTVIEAPVPPDYLPPSGEVRIASDASERVELELRADRQALLVLNDAFAEGWTAEVDARPAEILPVNYLARGVWVEAGAHRVVFSYRTARLAEGWAVLALLGVGLSGWGWRRRRGAS